MFNPSATTICFTARHCRSTATLTIAILLTLSSLRAQTVREPLVPAAQTQGGGVMPLSGSVLSNGGLSDGPIRPGDMVHVSVYNAPDLGTVTRVSMAGEIAVPLLGPFHIEGLTSLQAQEQLAHLFRAQNIVLHPYVVITREAASSGITVLGEVHSPGIFPPPGKHLLSDLLAAAGGVTANTGRIIEISNNASPEAKTYVPWDPTMHNTASYDRPVSPGDRIIVRACGITYVGGHVAKPGAYSLCGSPQMHLSEVLALAGGILPLSSSKHTVILHTEPDGSRSRSELDAHKVLTGAAPDVIVQEDDIIYVPPSGIKNFAKGAMAFSLSLVSPLLYVYR